MDNCHICSSSREIYELIVHVEELIKVKNSVNNKMGRIILEETVIVLWDKIKKNINKISYINKCLERTLFWKINRTKKLAEFIEDNIKPNIGPCDFSDFLEKLINRDNIEDDIKFLKWILESPSRCSRVFTIIKV
jgi:hypothetical protein